MCVISQALNLAITTVLPFFFLPVTLEFLVLLSLSLILTALPLALLLWQSRRTVSKHNWGFLVSSDDTSELLEDNTPNFSIQGGYCRARRSSLTNFPG